MQGRGGIREMPICPWNQTEAHTPTEIKNENYSSQLVDNKWQKSAPNKLLKAKDDEKKDVKNEGCSQ